MSQNVPNLAFQRRIPIIAQGVKDGLTYEEIGKTCIPPVSRRQIYRDRQSIEYHAIYTLLHDEYVADLSKLRASPDPKERRLGIVERGKFIRNMGRSAIPTRIEAKLEHGPMSINLLLSDTLEALPPEEEKDESTDA